MAWAVFWIDRFFLVATFLGFMVHGEAVATTTLAHEGKESISKKIDRIARYLHIAIFGMVVIIGFFI